MRYKILGQHTGLRASELVLGTGMFGTKWGHGADAQEARRIFDGYLEAGGNFLDTSDSYQFGDAETLLAIFSSWAATMSFSRPNTPRAPTPRVDCRRRETTAKR